MRRADRLFEIIQHMRRRPTTRARDLAEALEVSERTARRDLEGLALAGVPVYSQPGRGGGWELVGGARTDLSGLTADGLVLANGASTAGVVKGSTSFRFTTPVFDGANYGVTVLAQPAGQVCTVANATGTMPSGDVLTVAVSCQPAA